MLFLKVWFPPKEIKHYYPYLVVSLFLGFAFGAYMPFLYVKEDSSDILAQK